MSSVVNLFIATDLQIKSESADAISNIQLNNY